MDIDLNQLSLRELKDIQARVAKAISSYEDRKRKEVYAELEAKAKEMGYSLNELMTAAPARANGKRSHGEAKFANPANSADTWTGRGRKPRWFLEAIAAGRSEDDLLI